MRWLKEKVLKDKECSTKYNQEKTKDFATQTPLKWV
jgi:hypothetical protein